MSIGVLVDKQQRTDSYHIKGVSAHDLLDFTNNWHAVIDIRMHLYRVSPNRAVFLISCSKETPAVQRWMAGFLFMEVL
ncbi:MAG: hypothetical protein H6937_02265 [Burkholderiales bacterium]|nr:hypothetical protein [Burkholderiales bacterium]